MSSYYCCREGEIDMKKAAIGLLALLIGVGCCGIEKDAAIKIKADVVKSVGVVDERVVEHKACPDGFIEINANYCPKTDELCLYWVTIDGERTKINTDRCGEFRKPVHCLVAPVKKHFCISEYEYPNKKGEIPKDWVSYNEAKKIAETNGNRLCTNSEWTTAASGNEYLPYPFGDGFHRDKSCNIDQRVHGVDIMKVSDPKSAGAAILRSKLVPSGSMPNCVSSEGVKDLSGNEDEFVYNESKKPYVSGLMGGFFGGVRNRSRAVTTGHNEYFRWYESGLRECRDIQK